MKHARLLSFLLPLAGLSLWLLSTAGDPPGTPFCRRSAPSDVLAKVSMSLEETPQRQPMRGLYDLQPGDRVDLAVRFVSLVEVRQGEAPGQQLGMDIQSRCRLTALARREGEWIGELMLVEPRVETKVNRSRGDATALVHDLRRPLLVRFGSDGAVRGYRFDARVRPEHRNVLRSVLVALRVPVDAVGEWHGNEGDAGGVAEVRSTRRDGADGTQLAWTRRGYPARTGRPAPTLEGRGVATAATGSTWWSETRYEESQRVSMAELQVEVTLSVTVNSRLLGITAAAVANGGDPWTGPWQPAAGDGEGEATMAQNEQDRWQQELAGVGFDDVVRDLIQLLQRGEDGTADAFRSQERLVWLLRLRPETVAALATAMLDPGTGDRLAAIMAGAAGAAATPATQQLLLQVAQAANLSEGRRVGTLVALVQVEQPVPAVTAALQAWAEGSGDGSLRSSSLLLLGAMAGRQGADRALFEHLIGFEATAQRDGLLADWLGSLGNTRSPAVMQPVLRHLDAAGDEVRAAALGALSQVNPEVAMPRLLHHAADDPAPLVRCKALELLAGRNDARVLPALERGLGDADDLVRRVAVLALGRSGDTPRVRELLAHTASGDPVSGIRSLAGELLGQLDAQR